MVKTPEEYFADQCLAVPQTADATLSVAEQAFVQKYLGSDALQTMPVLEYTGSRPGSQYGEEQDCLHIKLWMQPL